ncbi:hypothetical protein KI387_035604, partial [Taxus chinensis]
VDVVNLAVHWLCPTFYGNLASEVANLNMVSWSTQDVSPGSSSGVASALSDLERCFKVLMEFVESLSSYAKDKKTGRICIQLPNIKALGASLVPVPSWWAELCSSAGDAFGYLWRRWINACSVE